jgi:hypothetical protein
MARARVRVRRALTLVWSGSATYSQGFSLWDCADRTGRWLRVQPTYLDLELRQSNIDLLGMLLR